MIEPKEWKVMKAIVQIIEYKINSITNYIDNYEYSKANYELKKAWDHLKYLKIVKDN